MKDHPTDSNDSNLQRKRRRHEILVKKGTPPFNLAELPNHINVAQTNYLLTSTPAWLHLTDAAARYGFAKGAFSNLVNNLTVGHIGDSNKRRTLNRQRVDFLLAKESKLPRVYATADKIKQTFDYSGPWEEVIALGQYPAVLIQTGSTYVLSIDPRSPLDSNLTFWLIPPTDEKIDPKLEQPREKGARSIAESANKATAKKETPVDSKRLKNSESTVIDPKKAQPVNGDSLIEWLQHSMDPASPPTALEDLDFDPNSADRAKLLAKLAAKSGTRDLKNFHRELIKRFPDLEKYDAFRRVLIFGGIRMILESEFTNDVHLPTNPSSVRPIGIRPRDEVVAIQQRVEELVKCGRSMNEKTYTLAVEWNDHHTEKKSSEMIQFWEEFERDKELCSIVKELLKFIRSPEEKLIKILSKLTDEDAARTKYFYRLLGKVINQA